MGDRFEIRRHFNPAALDKHLRLGIGYNDAGWLDAHAL
jgi:hypothetical protein